MNSDEPYSQSLPILVNEIPRTLEKVSKGATLCRVILWYYDTCAPCCYFLADAMRESYRKRERLNVGNDVGSLTTYTNEPLNARIEAMIGNDKSSLTFSLFAKIYELLCTQGQMDESFRRLQVFVREVARTLNQTDWNSFGSVTDDFVIYPQNGTDYGCDTREDIFGSVPVQKLELLWSRGLLPSHWELPTVAPQIVGSS